MATKADLSIVAHPDWTGAQRTFFFRLKEALPILMGYLGEEIPVLDNTTDNQLVDEVGVLKQVKKTAEKAEKTHVERLKSRIGDKDSMRGGAYEATYRGSKRIILNQDACKELIQKANDLEINLGRLMAAIESKQISIPNNVFLGEVEKTIAPEDSEPYTVTVPETNDTDFFSTAAGGRSLYVEPIQ